MRFANSKVHARRDGAGTVPHRSDGAASPPVLAADVGRTGGSVSSGRVVAAAAVFVLAVGLVGLMASFATAADSCTRIQGFSQTNNWTNPSQGGFMPRDGFEVSWVSGASLRSWTLSMHDGWTTVDHGECGSPTVLAQQISGPEIGYDSWVTEIENFVPAARSYFPGVPIQLLAVVGSDVPCDTRASRNHPVILDAIQTVAGRHSDVSVGPVLTVSSCSGYSDSKGHLTTQGGQQAAAQAEAFWGGTPTTTTTTGGSTTTTEPGTTSTQPGTTSTTLDPRCERRPNHPRCQ